MATKNDDYNNQIYSETTNLDYNEEQNQNSYDPYSNQEDQQTDYQPTQIPQQSFDPLKPQSNAIFSNYNNDNDYDARQNTQEVNPDGFFNDIQPLIIEVPSFCEKKIDGGKNNVVFYQVVVGFQKNNKRWVLEKRYNEFDQLDQILKENYPNLPSMPAKTYFKLSEAKAIESRRQDLNNYLKALINRRDMRTCQTFRKFIQIEDNFPASQFFEAKKIGVMQEFSQGVRDFIYLPQYQTAFVAMSDMNIVTRLDSYFTNLTLPWERKGTQKKADSVLQEEAVATVGCLQHFSVFENEEAKDKNNGSLWRQQPSWGKTYASQTNILFWDDEKGILYIGLDSGIIHRYQCSKEKKLRMMNELPTLDVHNAKMRVMGLAVDPRVNNLFSISESGYLIVTDLNDIKSEKGKFLNSQKIVQSSGLKAMCHDIQRNVLFIASGQGEIFILNSIPTQPEIIHVIKTDKQVCIRGLTRSMNVGAFWETSLRNRAILQKNASSLTQNFLLASDTEGYITIFDVGAPGKEKTAKRVGNMAGKPKQRIVIWRDLGREIICGDEDGCVTFWYSKEGNPLYVLKAHSSAITQMRWNEDTQQLITCSKDKTVKLWQLPNRWIDERSFKQVSKTEIFQKPNINYDGEYNQEEVKTSSYNQPKYPAPEEAQVYNNQGNPLGGGQQFVDTSVKQEKSKNTQNVIKSIAKNDSDEDEDLMNWHK